MIAPYLIHLVPAPTTDTRTMRPTAAALPRTITSLVMFFIAPLPKTVATIGEPKTQPPCVIISFRRVTSLDGQMGEHIVSL